MESAIFQCGLRATDKSRETKRSIAIGSTMAILGRDPLARAHRVFMELKIEKLFGEEFAGKPAPERVAPRARFTPRPITDSVIRSFLRPSRAHYVGGNPRYHFPRLGEISLFESLLFVSSVPLTFILPSRNPSLLSFREAVRRSFVDVNPLMRF